ncbi:hypothetical protein SAMN04490209_2311 [Pseudomonas rhodesiae]|uniref:Uncharacterized protein n=1 Tax=Pseudomonas rhodesiae TaxID=76760 RepID=A0AAE8HC23_9PSED|nr:hypothetical protein SAMN04490209_2311 [Pseudomonas rhodesiae]
MIEFMMPLPTITRTTSASLIWTFEKKWVDNNSLIESLESCLSVFVGRFFK